MSLQVIGKCRLQLWGVQEGDPGSRMAALGGAGTGHLGRKKALKRFTYKGRGDGDRAGGQSGCGHSVTAAQSCLSKRARPGLGETGPLPRAKTYLTGRQRRPGHWGGSSSLPQNRTELV